MKIAWREREKAHSDVAKGTSKFIAAVMDIKNVKEQDEVKFGLVSG